MHSIIISVLTVFFFASSIIHAQQIKVQVPDPVVVGIIGDIHGNTELLDQALEQLKSAGVNVVIGMGDYTDFGNQDTLDLVLKKINNSLNIKKEHFLILAGNMESDFMHPEVMLDTFKKYGSPLASLPSTNVFIIINDNFRIMASHFPMTLLPEHLTPPKIKPDVQANMSFRFSPPYVDIILFADTHRGGSFEDPETGTLLFNVGTFSNRKYSDEAHSYGILVPGQRKIQRIGVVSNNTLDHKIITPRSPQADIYSYKCSRFRRFLNIIGFGSTPNEFNFNK